MSAHHLCTQKYLTVHEVVKWNEARKLEASRNPSASTVSTVSTAPSSLDGSGSGTTYSAGASSPGSEGGGGADNDGDCSNLSQEESLLFNSPFFHAFRRQAYCTDDMRMMRRFALLVGLDQKILWEGEFVKPLLRSMKLLHLCDYNVEDISCVMAHASVYFDEAYGVCGGQMDASEIGNVAVTLFFIAHSYTQDETCPLHVWHQHLFRKYCSVKTLNAALIRLLELRGYILRVDAAELQVRFHFLMHGTSYSALKDVPSKTQGGGGKELVEENTANGRSRCSPAAAPAKGTVKEKSSLVSGPACDSPKQEGEGAAEAEKGVAGAKEPASAGPPTRAAEPAIPGGELQNQEASTAQVQPHRA